MHHTPAALPHTLCLCLLLFCCASVGANSLNDRLRVLLPGEEPATVSEREYLSKQLENVFRALEYTDRIERRSTTKQVGLIQERYRGVLRQYDPAARLSDAFRSGTYNDATASLLLALALERFNLPYEGHVDHWESYLVADPYGKPTIVRHPAARPHTTATEVTYRREYLSLVREAFDLPLEELTPEQADSVFYRYYYHPARRLTFRQLSAYHQYRQARQAYASADYGSVNQHLVTASSYENRPAFLLLDRVAVIQENSLRKPDLQTYVTELFELWREEPDNRYLPAALLRQFDDQQQQWLSDGKPEAALDLLNRFQSRAPRGQTAWADRLHLLQSLRLIAYYREHNQASQALHLAESLLTREPDNVRYQQYVAELTLVGLRERYPDPGELVEQAERAALRYPFLRQHDRYADIILRQSALRVRDRFAAGDAGAGLRAIEEFREQLREIPNGHDRALWTLTAFVAASNYYFAEKEYVPARTYIEEALRHDPANDFLLHQQDLLSRY